MRHFIWMVVLAAAALTAGFMASRGGRRPAALAAAKPIEHGPKREPGECWDNRDCKSPLRCEHHDLGGKGVCGQRFEDDGRTIVLAGPVSDRPEGCKSDRDCPRYFRCAPPGGDNGICLPR